MGAGVKFEVVHDDHFRAMFIDEQMQFDIRYLRKERGEQHGDLRVSSGLSGARTFGDDETISAGTLNFSSRPARLACAKYLAARGFAKTKVDFVGMLEAVSDAVIKADRNGEPGVWLHELPKAATSRTYDVDGLALLSDHANGIFAPGGVGKSLLALYVGGRLSQQGVAVGFADSELEGADQRERLAQLFPGDLPAIRYVRCKRSVIHEVDRLREETAKHQIRFWIYDSVAFASDGSVNDADVATAYFRSVRAVGAGSLHIAHTNSSDRAEDRPFGSVFWFNGFRALWYLKPAAETLDPHRLTIGLFPKKRNIGGKGGAVGFDFYFDGDHIDVTSVDVRDVQELAESLPTWQRLKSALTRGPRTLASLAEELGANVDTLDRTVRRKTELFTRVPNPDDGITRIALVERRTA
jgi:hypothetical protein